jgi:hypothetical protein
MKQPDFTPGPPSGLSDDEAAAIFADQARVAREVALTDYERAEFENRPKLRGPIWFILPLATLLVVTLPIWGIVSLEHRSLAVAAIWGMVFVWRIVAWFRRRATAAAKGGHQGPTVS